MKTLLSVLLWATALPLAAMETKPPALAGTAWIVTAIDGDNPLPDRPVTIAFDDDNRISGQSSCNRYMGPCTIEGDKITVGPVAGTRMFCGEALMAQEQRFLDLLQTAQRWEISPDGLLVLHGAKGKIEARRETPTTTP